MPTLGEGQCPILCWESATALLTSISGLPQHRRFWSWRLWELILVEHYIEKTLHEGPAEPRTNRESEIERKAEQC